MADKIDAERQRNAIIALKALANAKGIHGDEEGLRAACETLLWLQSNRDVIALAMKIKSDETVKEIFKEWPDAKVSVVRKAVGV